MHFEEQFENLITQKSVKIGNFGFGDREASSLLSPAEATWTQASLREDCFNATFCHSIKKCHYKYHVPVVRLISKAAQTSLSLRDFSEIIEHWGWDGKTHTTLLRDLHQ